MAFKCVDQRPLEERVKSLVAEILAAEAAEGADWRSENIDDIENAMIRIGDLVAREVGVQKLAAHVAESPAVPQCPTCGHPGECRGPHARDLITRRGTVPVVESKFYCPQCRQLFFPSDDRSGN